MKNITKLGLTALACLVLSACGSSKGGDNSANQPPQTSPTVVNTPVVNPTPPAPISPVQNDNRTGGAFVISGEDDQVVVTRKAITSSDDFKQKIVLDGKEITIGFPGIGSGGWSNLGPIHTCCGRYSDVRFGVVESSNQNENDFFFYNGNVTQAMPASGTATYNGHFMVSGDTEQFEDEDYLTGTATFNADFANKTLLGMLSEPSLQTINVDAKIQGNGFNGSAKSATFRTTAEVEGKFYGKDAKELGGIFIDSQKTWGGAFGAAQ